MNTAMETQNVTLTLPKDVLHELDVMAAQRGTSISDLLIQARKLWSIMNDLVDARTFRVYLS